MERLIGFDFGNDSVPSDEDFIKVERLYRSPEYMWVCQTKNKWFSEFETSPYRDCLFGKEGEFQIGLPSGEYELLLYFYDPTKEWEPFEVVAGNAKAYGARLSWTPQASRKVELVKGEKQCVKIPIQHTGGILAVGFPKEYVINGLEVYGAAGTKLQTIYKESIPNILPPAEEVKAAGNVDYKKALHEICEWLMRNRHPDGFIGDYETCGRLWYTASYPIRSLLAGYDILGQQEYLDATICMLDLFVAEQMPEGSFTQSYRGIATEELSEEKLEAVRQGNWMNLADVGSAVAALAMACYYVKGERLERYVAAVKKYLDQWALPFQKPSGGFTNGWIKRMDAKIYSVSTATTTLACILFYNFTKDEKYLTVAEKAALYMADKWHADGRLWNSIFDTTYPGHDHYQDVEYFGDGFYTLEAIQAVLNTTKTESVKKTLFEVLHKYIFGEAGLLARKGEKAWWSLETNCWHLSKSAGIPMVFCDYLRFGEDFRVSDKEKRLVTEASESCNKFIATPQFSWLLGVMCDEPEQEYPFARHSIQCWNGCAAAATGIVGVALAHMIKPGMIFGNNCDVL